MSRHVCEELMRIRSQPRYDSYYHLHLTNSPQVKGSNPLALESLNYKHRLEALKLPNQHNEGLLKTGNSSLNTCVFVQGVVEKVKHRI